MKPVTVVTAYFDIGRKDFKAVPRTGDVYFEQFAFWARMRNHLVVYTDADSEARILKIRDKFGLLEQTTVLVLDDLFAIEPEIYESMRSVAQDQFFRDFRIMPNATSGIPEYSYLMLLKTWFLADAVKRGLTSETIAWLDFGFNHGGHAYPNCEEFDFEWSSESIDKVQLFVFGEYDERPIFEIIRRLSDYVMGATFLAPSDRAGELWDANREAMVNLLRLGLIDDDQLIQLLSYRTHPDLYDLRPSDWFKPLKDVAAPHLTFAKPVRRPRVLEFVRSLVHRWRRHRLAWATSVRLYRNLMRGRP